MLTVGQKSLAKLPKRACVRNMSKSDRKRTNSDTFPANHTGGYSRGLARITAGNADRRAEKEHTHRKCLPSGRKKARGRDEGTQHVRPWRDTKHHGIN